MRGVEIDGEAWGDRDRSDGSKVGGGRGVGRGGGVDWPERHQEAGVGACLVSGLGAALARRRVHAAGRRWRLLEQEVTRPDECV